MVNVGKEIDILWRLIDFNTVEPVVEQIEGSHPLTEERLVGLFIQRLYAYHGLLVIMALLHHVALCHNQTGLQVTVRIDGLSHGPGKPLRIHLLETVEVWDVILCRVAVQLPVDIDAALVLCQGIALPAFVGRKLWDITVGVCL